MADPWADFRAGGTQAGRPQTQAPVIGEPIFRAPPAQPTPLQQSAEQRAQEAADRAARAEGRADAAEDRAENKAARDAEVAGMGTESERTAGFLTGRVVDAVGRLTGAATQDPSSASPTLGVEMTRGVLGDRAANYITDAERQQVRAAQIDIIDAALTLGTGAAYTKEQIEGYREAYFPQLGDDPATVRSKQEALRSLLVSARTKAGRAAPDMDRALNALDLLSGAQQGFNDEQKTQIREFAQRANSPEELNDYARQISGGRLSLGNADDVLAYWRKHGEIGEFAPTPGDDEPPPDGGSGGGILSQLGTATQSAVAGAAQGVAGAYDLPMSLSTGLQRGLNWGVGRGGERLLNMVGARGAADWWRQGADLNDEQLANQPTAAGAIEQISPTPQGMGTERFLSQLAGGMMVPIGPKTTPRVRSPVAAPRAPAAPGDIIAEGARNNVRVMTSDVRPPTTFTGKVARATGERIPYAGTGGPRAAQQKERIEAVQSLARDFGVDAGGELLDEVANDLASTRGGRIANLTNTKNSVIDGIAGSVQAPRAIAAIDAQIARLNGINAERFAPVIQSLQNFRNTLGSGRNLREIEGNRKLLGDLFEDPSLAAIKGDGQKAINAIYGPLRDDMGDFIRTNAGDAAYNSWAKANEQLSAMTGELSDNVFRNVLQSAETTPENVARVLFSKKPSEVSRLMENMSVAGRRRAQGAIIERAVERAGGMENISPDKFANEISRLGKSVGVVFEGDELARIKGLERLLQATKQAGTASAAPPTGAQNMPFIMGAGVGATGGTGGIALAAAGALARIYESAAVRNLLTQLGKVPPGSQAEGRLLQRILKVATLQSQNAGPAISRAANENLPIAAQSVAQERNSGERN